jgi:hypothetical protein
MNTSEKLAIEALRETLKRPIGYIDLDDEKYGAPPLDPKFGLYDPSKPPDPIFNPPPLPEPTFGEYLQRQQAEKDAKRERERQYRKASMLRLNNMTHAEVEQVLKARDKDLTLPLVVQMIRSRCFKSKTGLTGHLFKPSYWAKAFGRFLDREGLMSAKEFDASFSDRRGRVRNCGQKSVAMNLTLNEGRAMQTTE